MANLRIRDRTGASAPVVITGIVLMVITMAVMAVYLAANDPGTLGLVALLYVIVLVAERSWSWWGARSLAH